MPPHVTTSEAVRKHIQEQLAQVIQNKNSLADAYVRYEDIRAAWSGYKVVKHALRLTSLSDADFELIQKKLLRFLSILVYIGAHEFLDGFRERFFDNNGDLIYDDTRLPLEEQDVPSLGSSTEFLLHQRFFHSQFLFTPVCISISQLTIQAYGICRK
jgi:hypothetical protein